MGMIGYQITSLMIIFSIIDLDTDQRKHQNSTSLAFVQQIEFPTQMASNTENVSIWWHHHVTECIIGFYFVKNYDLDLMFFKP